jgi:hypothetical protein
MSRTNNNPETHISATSQKAQLATDTRPIILKSYSMYKSHTLIPLLAIFASSIISISISITPAQLQSQLHAIFVILVSHKYQFSDI